MRWINLGCGPDLLPPPWINADHRHAMGAVLGEHLIVHDVRDPFPWPDGSAEYIAHSHLLEHLTLEESCDFLPRCRRLLHVSGVMRIAVPDTRRIIAALLDGRMDDFASEQPAVYRQFNTQGLKFGYFMASAGVSTRSYYSGHKMFWDEEGLREILNLVGFSHVVRCAFGESDRAPLRGIDRHENHSLYLDCA